MSTSARLLPSLLTLILLSLCAVPTALAVEPLDAPPMKFEPYGFILPTYTLYNNDVESFGRLNASAATAAANPVFIPDDAAFSQSFQLAQSRIGLNIRNDSSILGQLEIDFIDFNKATPTTASLPRLRVASIEWRLNERHVLKIGQFWDVAAYVQPVHTNAVGAHFQSGNVGFIRDQVAWLYRPDTRFEIATAVGLAGSNNGPSLSSLERGITPSLALRLSFLPNAKSRVGLSGLFADNRFTQDTHRQSLLANLFMDLVLEGGTTLRGELNFGQNLANVGMLGLSQGHAGADVHELGGWLSLRQPLSEHTSLSFTLGVARVLDPQNMLLGYVPATAATPASRALENGPGIEQNIHLRAGVSQDLGHGLSLHVEPTLYSTRHKLAAADARRVDATQLAAGGQIAALYSF